MARRNDKRTRPNRKASGDSKQSDKRPFPYLLIPFILLIVVVAASTAFWALRSRSDSTTAFVTRDELRRSLSVLGPTVALVVAMVPLGCYVPSALYLAWMMRRHGGHGWLVSAAYGAAVAIAFFLVFDLWFRVPLAKGPVEAALGLY